MEELIKLLEAGPTSIRIAALWLGRSTQSVYAICRANPDKFSIVGIVGSMETFCIGLADDYPIQMILPKELR